MTEKKAIERLQRIRQFYLDTIKDDAAVEAVDMAIKAVEKQEADRWIPVTERLPEEDCSCRVTEGDFKSVFDCYWSNRKKQFEVWSNYQDDYLPITNVTAWKPIEEPYMEEEA
jgi:hypothetical protein